MSLLACDTTISIANVGAGVCAGDGIALMDGLGDAVGVKEGPALVEGSALMVGVFVGNDVISQMSSSQPPATAPSYP